MTEKERALRLLTIRPEDLRAWHRMCREVTKEVAAAHPNYPALTETQLLSFVKRLLPRVRALIAADPE
jgi:hypothetical protein